MVPVAAGCDCSLATLQAAVMNCCSGRLPCGLLMPGLTSAADMLCSTSLESLDDNKAKGLSSYLIERNSGPHLLCFNLAARNLLLQLQHFLT